MRGIREFCYSYCWRIRAFEEGKKRPDLNPGKDINELLFITFGFLLSFFRFALAFWYSICSGSLSKYVIQNVHNHEDRNGSC